MNSSQKKEIIVKLKGEKIKNHTIDVEELGHFLINLQGLFTEYSKDKYYSTLYLKEIREGSVELVLEGPSQYNMEYQNIFESNYKEFINTIETINLDPLKAREKLSNSFQNLISRIRVETKLKNIFTEDISVGFSDSVTPYIFLKPERRKDIEQWIEEDYKRGVKSINGIILRIKGDAPTKHFTILTDTGDIIKCYYSDEDEDKIIEYFKRQPITIKGYIGRKVKFSEIKEILDIKPWNKITLETIGNYELKQAVSANITYEDDVWCLSAEEINTIGCGESFTDALRDFKTVFNEIVDIYTKEYSVDDLDENAKKLRQKLTEIIKGA